MTAPKAKSVLRRGWQSHKHVIINRGRYSRKKAGVRRQFDPKNDAGANEIARIANRHAESHFNPAIGLDPFAGAKAHTARTHVFRVPHKPASGPDAAKLHRQLQIKR
jgi:hypothetical protein